MPQGLLSRTEVMNYLGCDDASLEDLIQSQKLARYKIAGEYERFSKTDVIGLKRTLGAKTEKRGRGAEERIWDFWQYNNFYIITSLVLSVAVYYFFFG